MDYLMFDYIFNTDGQSSLTVKSVLFAEKAMQDNSF